LGCGAGGGDLELNNAEVVDAIREAHAALLATVEGGPPARLTQSPPGEWSVAEVLSHLVDVDYYYLSEALATCAQARRSFQYFDDETWKAQHPDARTEPVPSIIARLRASNATVLAAVAALPEVLLATPAVHPRGIPYTVRDILLRLPNHDANHVEQMRSILAGAGRRRLSATGDRSCCLNEQPPVVESR
jgi:uncharacterized damage-inducible protein DinB